MAPQHSSTDFDSDDLNDAVEHDLATRYAPLYQFHPNENYYFIDPGWYISRTTDELRAFFNRNPDCGPYHSPDDPQFRGFWGLVFEDALLLYWPDSRAFASDIGSYNAHNEAAIIAAYPQLSGWFSDHTWNQVRIAKPRRCYLDDWFEQCPWGNDPCPDIQLCCYWHSLDTSVPIFYIVERNVEGNIELQFWAYSHFDETYAPYGYGEHDGDWTRVVFVFGVRDEAIVEPPIYGYYSAHREDDCPHHPRYLLWDDIDKVGTHPRVMVAWGTHENYFRTQALSWAPGETHQEESIEYEWQGENCLVHPFYVSTEGFLYTVDYHDPVGGGLYFMPDGGQLINLGNADAVNPETPWATYGGRWGFGNDDPLDSSDGPPGPFGIGDSTRFREHNILASPEGDDGSLRFWYQLKDGESCEYWNIPHALRGVLDAQLFMKTEERWGPPKSYYVDGTSGLPLGAPCTILVPSRTVNWAAVLARSGSAPTLFIRPGAYGGTLTVSDPMTLKVWWGLENTGTVRIGQ